MVTATGRPWGQYFTRPAMTSRTTTSSSSCVFFCPPLMAALQAMVCSTASRAAWGSAPVPFQIVGDLPHHKGPAAKLFAGKAKLRQQVQVVQQRNPLLRGRGKDHGGQQGLCHGLVARGLHAVEVHPLVGGVFVDEVDRVPLLHDEVGLQDFSGQPPRRFLGGRFLRRGRRDRHRFRCLGLGRRLQEGQLGSALRPVFLHGSWTGNVNG